VLFRISLPRDADLVPAVRDVAERLAQCAGYTSEDAVRIASSVGLAADAVMRRWSEARPEQQIDVSFESEWPHLDVWLRYRLSSEECASGPRVPPPETFGEGMDSVEFGREDGVAFCHLQRLLPHEKVDHRCEMPPPETP
jgi:hypothetical protein